MTAEFQKSILALLVPLFFLSCNSAIDQQEEGEYIRPNLEQRIIGRIEQEKARLRDPKTGDVPSERLLKAQEHIQKKYQTKTAIPNINWEERGPNDVAGRTRAILIDSRDATGNTLFAGGVSGGIWKTTDGGSNWTIINDFYNNLAVTSIVQDPNNANIIYFGTGENWAFGSGLRGNGIYVSTNGGVSFTPIAFTVGNKDFEYINRLAIQNYNGNTVLYAATASSDLSKGGLLISQDGGNSWLIWRGNNGGVNDFASDVKITSPASDNNNQSIVIAAFGGGNDFDNNESDGLWWSFNGGSTWFRYYTTANTEGRIELATSPGFPYINYIMCEDKRPDFPPSMHGSWFNGTNYNFVPISPPIQGWIDNDPQNCQATSMDITRGQDFYDLAIAVTPSNPYSLIVGGVDLWIYQRDPTILSDSWLQISHWAGFCNFQKVHADQHIIVFENDDEVWIGNDGGVWKLDGLTTNNNAQFSFRGNNLNITQYYCADADPNAGVNKYIAGSQDNGTQFYKSPGINSTDEVVGGDGAFCHIDQTNGDVQIASYTHQNMFVTLDGWQSVFQGTNGTKGRFINPSEYDDNNKKVYACDGVGTYFRWDDPLQQGMTTTTVSVSSFPTTLSDNGIWALRLSPNVVGRMYFGFDGGIIVKVDNAQTGSSKTGMQIMNLGLGNDHVVSCIEIEKGNEDHILVTLSNYGITSVYESINATAANPTWIAVEGNLPDLPVRWAMFNPNNSDQAFIATEMGIWSTSNLNGGSTDWDPTNLGLSNTRVDMIKYRESDLQMVVATHGRGLFTSDALAGTCESSHNLNGITVLGSYRATNSISLTNCTITNSAILQAPQVNLNGELSVSNGATLLVNSDGCL